MSATDRRYMALALSLGRRGRGRTWPNPSVGCVLVRDGRIVGRGVTADGGRPHAEVIALRQAGARAKNATAYVSLEPCSHHGKTPPCTEALIAAGVARVVAPLSDQDPRVDGQGFEQLRAAGIDVTTGVLADQAAADHAGFFLKVKEGRPWVTLKLASSFDGRIATATGESRWITGPHARRIVHAMRADHDAVLVGAGTARADDPDLRPRDLGISHKTVRVVASRRLDLPLSSRLTQSVDDAPVWICHGPDVAPETAAAWRGLGVRLLACELQGRQLNPADMLGQLGQQGLTRVFCEGGGALAASLVSAGLVDRIIGFTAGLALGAEGLPSIGALGVDRLGEAARYRLVACRPVGDDILHIWDRTTDA